MKTVNPRIILCIGLVLSGVFFGCSTTRRDLGCDLGTEAVELPLKFPGYRELYTFIAEHNVCGGMPANPDTLFKLAADSTTEIIGLEDKELPCVYLVESHYYNGGVFDLIRGAQGNGDYYILRPLAKNYTELDTDKGFELVGIAQGNSCKLTYSEGKPRFVTRWHLSSDESPESIYEWNSKVFKRLK